MSYYALSKDESWAVMSHVDDDPNPPIIIFESLQVAQRYCEIVAPHWEIVPIDDEEIDYQANDSGNRIMLCTSVANDRIHEMELSLEQLMQRIAEAN
jgi:hypothetical protein